MQGGAVSAWLTCIHIGLCSILGGHQRCELGRVAVLQCIPSPLNTLFYCAVCANGNEEQPLLCPNTLACVDLDSVNFHLKIAVSAPLQKPMHQGGGMRGFKQAALSLLHTHIQTHTAVLSLLHILQRWFFLLVSPNFKNGLIFSSFAQLYVPGHPLCFEGCFSVSAPVRTMACTLWCCHGRVRSSAQALSLGLQF
eukprot:1159794-Pelagomonas_calceolata.AAC.2